MADATRPKFASIRDQGLRLAVTLLFALYAVTLTRYTESAKICFGLLLLLGLFWLLLDIREIARTSAAERFFFAVLGIGFLWTATSFYLNWEPGQSSAFLWGRHVYLLFMVPLYFLFRRVSLPDRTLLLILAGSVLFTLADMLIDVAQGKDHLVQGMNQNGLGPIQLCLTGILLLASLNYPVKPYRWLFFFAFLCGLATVVLSKSKNTWMTLAVLAVLAVLYLSRSRPAWQRAGLVGLIVLLLASSYLLPIVKSRIDNGFESVVHYFASTDYRDDSRLGTFGTRIELWKTGWRIFLDHPIFGAGVGSFQKLARQNSERYQVNDIVHRFKYVHNQYIAALATRGVPGLILFLLFLTTPIYIAMKRKSDDPAIEIARISIILICLNYLVGSIWEDHFEVKSATLFVTVLLPLLLARISADTRRKPSVPNAR